MTDSRRIEDYAMIADCKRAALINKHGRMDWLCLPHYDSPACFASLLGTKENGYWQIRPKREIEKAERSYKDDTLVLDTDLYDSEGGFRLTDFMTLEGEGADLIRCVEGLKGTVKAVMELVPRFEYGALIPLFKKHNDKEVVVIKGPHQLILRSSEKLEIREHKVVCEFELSEGQEAHFHLCWTSSPEEEGKRLDVKKALAETCTFWRKWLEKCHLDDESSHPEIIRRSVLTLKAMTFRPAGSIVAAVTTSLPEADGGERNWDYRYCWPRDAALAIRAVLSSTGQREEIEAWRHWVIRATAGLPEQTEVLYKLDGTRPLSEMKLKWLEGFRGATPVRIGNKAHDQLQLDIFGAVIEVFYLAECMGLERLEESWNLVRDMLKYLEKIWTEKDEGIWEVRGPKRHFVHSKLMVWAAFKWGIKAIEELGVEGPLERWKQVQGAIHDDICRRGFNKDISSFVMFYGSDSVDANLLRMPILEFLPVDDPRIKGTIKRIEEELLLDEGLLMRYKPDEEVEGLPEGGKRAFLLCSSWLGEVYVLQGRREEARRIFKKLVSIANDVGLLAEQYDTYSKEQRGNFPQAFSHIALIHLELALSNRRVKE